MSKIALLVPNEEMFRQTHDVLQELKYRLDIMKVIETENAVTEARQAINQGADIIIARGLQATIIKQYTDIPVVEIVLTEQTVMDMLERAKRILNKPAPNVAIVMFKNMACDMAGLAEKCGVQLREYYVQNPELLHASAVQAVEDRADLIIGGATVLKVADAAGIPSLFLANTEDAIAIAIREAMKLGETFEKGEPESERKREAGAAAFVNFPYQSRKMQAALELASLLAETGCPKLIVEPVGTLYHAVAHAIHTHSRYAKEKIISHDCVSGEDAYTLLFGHHGQIIEAGKGTVQINFIENLDFRSQKKLLEILMFRNVIAVAKVSPRELRTRLIPELYERLRPFTIEIPSLDETPEDIPLLIREYVTMLAERYGRFHVLTKEAEQFLTKCSWPGNRIQLESFLERLILCARKRNIGAEEVRTLYGMLYDGEMQAAPETGSGAAVTTAVETEEPVRAAGNAVKVVEYTAAQTDKGTAAALSAAEQLEKTRLMDCLSRNLGNRTRMAAELGISKTTLWRKLKQYALL